MLLIVAVVVVVVAVAAAVVAAAVVAVAVAGVAAIHGSSPDSRGNSNSSNRNYVQQKEQ